MTKKGVLLVNLGSPDSTNVKDVKRYLGEFLMDERVIDMPYWKRFLLVKGIILNVRPKKSAKAYRKIWWKEGSPLVVLSEKFTEKVQGKTHIPVELAMRYGSMSIRKGIGKLVKKNVNHILLVPLYPHYAMSSYETVVVKAQEVIERHFSQIKMDVHGVFYDRPDYINAQADNIKKHLEGFEYDHVLFSYHGIPERHIKKSDPTKSHCKIDGSCCNTPSEAHKTCYRHQCFETTKALAKTLNLAHDKHSNSFQSRLLRDPWLKPYTDHTLEAFPGKGVEKLAVVTPAFVTDCLETLEEIAMEGKKEFMENGGTAFKYVPCLNDQDSWVDVMVQWIEAWAKL